MRKVLLLLFVCSLTLAALSETASLKEVPSNVFVNKGLTDFERILLKNKGLKQKVEELFQVRNLLQHESSKVFDKKASFSKYWKQHQDNWFEVVFNKKGDKVLLYFGKVIQSDIKEHVEIYKEADGEYTRIWADHGNLLAYKFHPFTKELVLYQHKYPCCNSASHHIVQLRLIEGRIINKERFFVGRDNGDMKGPFYPDTVTFPKQFNQLEEKTMLRWSPAEITEDAFTGRTHENKIIHFNKGAIYQVFFSNDEWSFVLLFNGISEEQSMVLNHTNFKNRPVYGWIRRKKPDSL